MSKTFLRTMDSRRQDEREENNFAFSGDRANRSRRHSRRRGSAEDDEPEVAIMTERLIALAEQQGILFHRESTLRVPIAETLATKQGVPIIQDGIKRNIPPTFFKSYLLA